MRLLIIFGPSAVGKATVGRAIAARTGMKLFHNHHSIEAVRPVFDFGTPQFNRLVKLIRRAIMAEAAASELPGLIFTYVWALNEPTDAAELDALIEPFHAVGAPVYYLELAASLQTRHLRNRHPDRLADKPSKRDTDTTSRILEYELKYQLNTSDGAFDRPNHLKVNNENLTPEQVAQIAIHHFDWPAAPA